MSNTHRPEDDVLAVGIDDGHDGIKISYVNSDNQVICYRMPSVAQEGIGDMASAPEHELKDMLITVNKDGGKVEYLVDAERKVIQHPMDTRFSEYPYSDLNIALIAQALRKAGVPYQKIFITAGLPANQFFDKQTNKINAALIEAKQASLNRLSQVRSAAQPNMFYQVVGVKTLPEGYGVSIDLTRNNEFRKTDFLTEVEDTGFIVLDIGGRTVDLVKIMANMQPRPGDSYSFDIGMLYLRDQIRSRVADYIGITSLSDKVVDAIIMTGWHGKPNKKHATDLTQMRDATIRSFADDVYSQVRGVINSSDEAMGGIVITGGGSHALGKAIEEALRKGGFRYEIYLDQQNPEFSNSRGFCKHSIFHAKKFNQS